MRRKIMLPIGIIASLVLSITMLTGLAFAVGSPVADTDDAVADAADILALRASSDGSDITVELDLDGASASRFKYRIHFDYKNGMADDADRNDDGFVDGLDFCFTTSDDTSKLHRNKETGPGSWDGAGTAFLTLTVPYGDLTENDLSAIDPGDTVFIWADTQRKGIQDRAPDTDDGNGCAKPESTGEVLELVLN